MPLVAEVETLGRAKQLQLPRLQVKGLKGMDFGWP